MSNGASEQKKGSDIPRTPKQINDTILKALETMNPTAEGLKNQDFILSGFSRKGQVIFKNSTAGNYFGAFNNGTVIKLGGSAGKYLGLGLTKGDIIVTKNVGDGVATYQSGGIIVVRGSCGSHAGQGMLGGTLFVEGNCKGFVGKNMVDGEIIVVWDCGEQLGLHMKGGSIFVRGEIESIGQGARTQTLGSKDKTRLQGIFKDFNMDYESRDFVKVIPEVRK